MNPEQIREQQKIVESAFSVATPERTASLMIVDALLEVALQLALTREIDEQRCWKEKNDASV